MNEVHELEIPELLKLLWKKAWIILLCAVIVASSVLVYTANFVEPLYTASVSIYVNNNSSQNSTAISSSDLAVALRLVNTYINILSSDRVLQAVIEKTGAMLTVEQLRGMLSAEAMGETEMFWVNVTSTKPQEAADIANALAEIAPSQIADIIEGSYAKVIDYAKTPTHRSSPSYTKNTITGFVVGMLGAALLIVILHLTDIRIKGENDLIKAYRMPVLGKIPDMDFDNEMSKKVRR